MSETMSPEKLREALNAFVEHGPTLGTQKAMLAAADAWEADLKVLSVRNLANAILKADVADLRKRLATAETAVVELVVAGRDALSVLDEVIDSFPDNKPPHPSVMDCVNRAQSLRRLLASLEAST